MLSWESMRGCQRQMLGIWGIHLASKQRCRVDIPLCLEEAGKEEWICNSFNPFLSSRNVVNSLY